MNARIGTTDTLSYHNQRLIKNKIKHFNEPSKIKMNLQEHAVGLLYQMTSFSRRNRRCSAGRKTMVTNVNHPKYEVDENQRI